MIITPNDLHLKHPLYLIPRPHSISHMLRDADINPVEDVVELLQKYPVDVFLGGGVLRDWITNGKRDYNDVDLLAVFNDENGRSQVFQTLTNSQNKTTAQNGETYPIFDFERTNQLVMYLNEEHKYMGVEIDEMFELLPIRKIEPLGLVGIASKIDLSLVSSTKFKRIYCR